MIIYYKILIPYVAIIYMVNRPDIHKTVLLLQVFLTAYLELVMLGGLSKGQSCLIHAGASGVGQ